MILLVNNIWVFVDKDIQNPMDPKELEAYEELNMKAKMIILDGVKYHLIAHLTGKNTTR